MLGETFSRLAMAEDRLREPENGCIEMIHIEEWREERWGKEGNKNLNKSSVICETASNHPIYVTGKHR